MSKYMLTLCVVLGLAMAAQATPLAVLNGDFEGTPSGDDYYDGDPVMPGWVCVADPDKMGGNPFGYVTAEPFLGFPGDDGQFVYQGSGTGVPTLRIVNTLADTFQMGYTYTLTASVASYSYWLNDRFEADLRVGTWDGAVALRLDQTTNPEVYATEDTWHTISGSVTITDPTMVGQAIVITLGNQHGLRGDGNGFHLWDSASVDMVPEPMTMTLLALGGLGLLRRRR